MKKVPDQQPTTKCMVCQWHHRIISALNRRLEDENTQRLPNLMSKIRTASDHFEFCTNQAPSYPSLWTLRARPRQLSSQRRPFSLADLIWPRQGSCQVQIFGFQSFPLPVRGGHTKVMYYWEIEIHNLFLAAIEPGIYNVVML